ncbi:trigger factor [Dehalobacter sp. TBBPA1]|uniref:trigger factor n=1 Tax=Dehalobacter sp. TBBPA1 TaxID=3235037 RepID=UPI0034A50763
MHHFQLGQYKGMKITSQPMPTEAELENAVIQSVLKMIDQWSKTNRVVEEGDEVAVSIFATCDGLAVSELCSSYLKYKVGDPMMFDQFKNAIGKKKADRFQMIIDIPQNSPLQHVAGKKAEFLASVLEVWPAKQLQITDAIIHEVDPEVSDMEMLKEKIRRSIIAESMQTIKENDLQTILDTIIESSTYELDEEILAAETQQVITNALKDYEIIKNQNANTPFGSSEADEYFYEDCAVFAKQQLLLSLAFKELARVENICISDEEAESGRTQILEGIQGDQQMFEKLFPTPELLKQSLLHEKIIKHLYEWNIINN